MASKLLNTDFVRGIGRLGTEYPFEAIDPTCELVSYFRKPAVNASDPEVVDMDRLPNPKTPWLMLAPEKTTDQEVWDCFYSVTENLIVRINRGKSFGVPSTTMCAGSTHGWLCFVDHHGLGSVCLVDPYKRNNEKYIVALPPLSTLPRFTDPNWEFASNHYSNWSEFKPKYMVDVGEGKSLLSNFALSHPDPWNPNCIVAANQHHYDDKYPNVSYFPIGMKLNNETEEFSWFEPDLSYLDGLKGKDWQLVFSSTNNVFYGTHNDMFGPYVHTIRIHNKSIEVSRQYFEDMDYFSEDGFLEDLDGPDPVKLVRGKCEYDRYAVALDNGDLLVILRYYCTLCFGEEDITADVSHSFKEDEQIDITLHLDVFRVDFENSRLSRLESLDGKSLFIGHNHSFCGEFPGMLPDCIYFSIRKRYSFYRNCAEVGIFNMKDNTILPCYPFDAEAEWKFDPFWVAPNA